MKHYQMSRYFADSGKIKKERRMVKKYCSIIAIMEGGLIINGPYGDMFLDKLDDKVIVFAEGEGTAMQLSYVYYDDAYWIVISDTTHGGRQMYSFTKYAGADHIVDSFELNAEYWDQDYYDENSDFTYRGEKIAMEQYEQIYNSIFK